ADRDAASSGRTRLEPGAVVTVEFDPFDVRHPRPFGAAATQLEHLLDRVAIAREHGLDGAVAPVPDPSRQPELGRLLHRPRAEVHALHPAADDGPHRLLRLRRHDRCYSNSMITSSTASVSPGLQLILATTPSRSARRMFSIFIASTTHSGSPVFTSWPTSTAIDTINPGIGQSSTREVSAAACAGIRAASRASVSV